MSTRSKIRGLISQVTRRTPVFRGLGRCVLFLDRFLTSAADPESYEAEAQVNGSCTLLLDLRSWEQKFAYYYGVLEPELTALVKRHQGAGVFYDIGASIGLYSMQFGRICRDNGTHLRAIEPHPLNIARLRSQFVRNGLDDLVVRVEEVALGESDYQLRLVLVEDGTPGNAKVVNWGDLRVPSTTLDALWRRHDREPIGFVKIDTEGWDAKIILGGQEAIRTCRPNMLVEFNREQMTKHKIPIDPAWEFLTVECRYTAHRVAGNGALVRIDNPRDFENLFFLKEESADRTS